MICSEQLDKIGRALVRAQAEFRPVAKSGENKFDRYTYAKLEDYVRAVSPVLAKHGLAVVTSVDSADYHDPRPTKHGSVEYHAAVSLTLTILHESGQWISVEGQGEGQDRGDKAIYKCMTGARKYALAAALNLATTDEPEEEVTENAKSPGNVRNIAGDVSVTAALPARSEKWLAEQWGEHISQLAPPELLSFFTAAAANSAISGSSSVWPAVCNYVAERTRAVARKGGPERAAIAALLKQERTKQLAP